MNETKFTRAGGTFAGVTFVLAYCVLLFDPVARAQMWPWVISTGACIGLLIWDERRLPESRLALAFPASRNMHVLAFGPLAVIVHFIRTRWPLGIARALGAAIVAGLVVTVPEVLVSMIGSPSETLEDLPVTIVALVIAPLLLALVWAVLNALQGLFDLERALVLVGIFLVFGSTAGIAVALHESVVWIGASLAVLAGAIVLALREPRG
jgi:hypothetical protein